MGSRAGFLKAWRRSPFLLDVIGHIVLALILPGLWWLQFTPDIFVPIIWIYSFCTDRFLPINSFLVSQHRALHSIFPVVTFVVLAFWAFSHGETTQSLATCCAAIQWLCHILWDQYTHRASPFQKRLLYPFVQ